MDTTAAGTGSRRALPALVVLALALGCAGSGWWWFHREPEPWMLPGTVEIQEVRLGSKVGGRVAEVLVKEGNLIEYPGTPLIVFEAPVI